MLWAGTLVLSLGVTRTVIALPERCGTATPAVLTESATEAVDWFARNQSPDGTWRYRTDVSTGRDLGGYNWVRHAGVLFSLEQAAGVEIAGAQDVAERGEASLRQRFVAIGDTTAVDDNGVVTTGGTALTLVALTERAVNVRSGVADASVAPDPVELRSLARFLVGRTTERGSVLEVTDRATGVSDPTVTSPFATGQVMFALARMELLYPGEGWGEPVRHIARYLATERADAEGFVPDASDHWAAYAMATVSQWPNGALTSDELSFGRRQMGIGSVQVRFESHKTNGGIDRWLRGRTSLGSGVGTLGELLGAWEQVAVAEPALASTARAIDERLQCLAGVLVDRQVSATEAAAYPDPSVARGAWLQFGITQMDDQQHTLSALILANRTSADVDQLPRRSAVPSSTWLLAIAVVAALNPMRIMRRSRVNAVPVGAVGAGGALGAVVFGAVAAVGGPVIRALDVSRGNAVIAAGLALAIAGLVSVFERFDGDRWATGAVLPGKAAALMPVLIPWVLRPEVVIVAIAAGAGGKGWIVFATALAAVALAAIVALLGPSGPLPPASDALATWLQRLLVFATIATGVAIVIDGFYAI